MKLRILGAADKGLEFGKEREAPGVPQKIQPERRRAPLQHELSPLFKDSLGRNGFEREVAAEGEGFGSAVQIKKTKHYIAPHYVAIQCVFYATSK